MIAKPSSPLIAIRMPPELLEEVDQLAKTEFVSRSDVIRTFVREKLAERRKAA